MHLLNRIQDPKASTLKIGAPRAVSLCASLLSLLGAEVEGGFQWGRQARWALAMAGLSRAEKSILQSSFALSLLLNAPGDVWPSDTKGWGSCTGRHGDAAPPQACCKLRMALAWWAKSAGTAYPSPLMSGEKQRMREGREEIGPRLLHNHREDHREVVSG